IPLRFDLLELRLRNATGQRKADGCEPEPLRDIAHGRSFYIKTGRTTKPPQRGRSPTLTPLISAHPKGGFMTAHIYFRAGALKWVNQPIPPLQVLISAIFAAQENSYRTLIARRPTYPPDSK